MNPLLRVAIICGGKSAEHEISLISAMNIIRSLDREKYEPVIIGIDHDGRWWLQDETAYMQLEPNPKTIKLPHRAERIAVMAGFDEPQFINVSSGQPLARIDVVFPILHGPMGEDGSLQGMLRHLDVAFVGPDVLASSAGMDKDFTKRLLSFAGIANSRFMVFHRHLQDNIRFDNVAEELGMPVFIKPANMGSSVGVSRARNREEFEKAVQHAFRFDTKIVVEESIKGREIEVAVLGNEFPRGSIPGEVVPVDGFYSYDAKYIDEKGARLDMPAQNLTQEQVAELRDLAVYTCGVLGVEGLSRVDFFLQEDGRLLVNEINTIPGFTPISMYPKLWELSGVPQKALISELIELGLERHKRFRELTSRMEF